MFVPFTDATVPRIVLLNICTPPTVVSEPTPSASSITSISPATSLPSTEPEAVTLIELVSDVIVNPALCSVKFWATSKAISLPSLKLKFDVLFITTLSSSSLPPNGKVLEEVVTDSTSIAPFNSGCMLVKYNWLPAITLSSRLSIASMLDSTPFAPWLKVITGSDVILKVPVVAIWAVLSHSVKLVSLAILLTLPIAPADTLNVSPTDTCLVKAVPWPATVGLAEVVVIVPVPAEVANAIPISPVLINFFWSIDGTLIALLELSTKLVIA